MDSGREGILRTLHAAATEVQACETVETACERTIAAAEEVLAFEMCSVVLHEDGWLVPVAMSSGAPEDGARRMRDDQGLAGKTFQTGEPQVVREIQPDDDTDPAKEFYRSGMSVPIGDVGVFQAVSEEPAAFDDDDVEFVELLVAHTARALDRIRYERELQRQNDRLAEFAEVVSHDLRNPLNVATGELALAREECDSEHLAVVARQHDRMEALIEDLLSLANESQPVESEEPVDLTALADECWSHVATEGAALTVAADLTVRANPFRLRQLLENLFRNAVEHGSTSPRRAADAVEHGSERPDLPERGDHDVTVTVGALADGFSVADDGPGIPEDDRGSVFERGYSTTEDGTGFGLAIVREVAEAHGWSVDVTASKGGGARFEITGVDVA